MTDAPLMQLSPEMEALQLLDDAASVMADELGEHIARLNYMVGRGIVPTDKTRLLWASQLASKFGGMIRTAIEGERAKAQLMVLPERLREECAQVAEQMILYSGQDIATAIRNLEFDNR